ncbi:hypothetical protein DV711_07935 [Motiliproteus coralliicola]|uniref:Lipoprotein n=1 Tax=Motiliproteus coralliicola TaxID=2283196 RepID=A0A369WPM2_9GAMM|nr:hypothetical protein [Motiliproteus coralliicola]RDE22516.1 hypothetical protein DV711_07935 [Motiliproteus coralliicola]
MLRAALLFLSVLLLSGCGPSYEEEYKATLAELQSVKTQLAEAQRKLSAADNENRSKIYLLVRRAQNHIGDEDFDREVIVKVQQEMKLLLESYRQLNSNSDLTAITATFYTDKLNLLLQLRRDSGIAYDRQYNACLSDLDSQGKKTELSTMLCEVQADAARRKPKQQLLANLMAFKVLGDLLQDARQNDTPTTSLELEQRYKAELNKQLEKLAS